MMMAHRGVDFHQHGDRYNHGRNYAGASGATNSGLCDRISNNNSSVSETIITTAVVLN